MGVMHSSLALLVAENKAWAATAACPQHHLLHTTTQAPKPPQSPNILQLGYLNRTSFITVHFKVLRSYVRPRKGPLQPQGTHPSNPTTQAPS
jgi:hypothetical protein